MGELVIFGAIGAALVAMRLASRGAWKSAAADLGLRFSSPLLGGRSLQGSLRGYAVLIQEKSQGRNRRIVAEVHGVDPGFTLGRDSAFLRMIKPDIETGDQVFDERTRIEGSSDLALAMLGNEARRLTEIVVSGADGEVKGMAIRASLGDIRHAGSSLAPILDLAEVLRQPSREEIPARLAERALRDSSRGVRLQAFRRQASSFPRSAETVATAEQLLGEPQAGLRLEACRVLLTADPALGKRAAEVLADLAASQRVETSIRRTALESLVASPFRAAAVPTLASLLEPSSGQPPEMRRAALEGLVRSNAKAELLEVQPVGSTESEILARGLGQTDLTAQPRLLQFLEHPEDRVRRAAVKSLGRIGDLGAVATLRQIAGTGTLFRSAVAQAAEEAIGEIKERAGGSQRGEISLAGVTPLEGAVSPATSDGKDERGGRRQDGEVSLTWLVEGEP